MAKTRHLGVDLKVSHHDKKLQVGVGLVPGVRLKGRMRILRGHQEWPRACQTAVRGAHAISYSIGLLARIVISTWHQLSHNSEVRGRSSPWFHRFPPTITAISVENQSRGPLGYIPCRWLMSM